MNMRILIYSTLMFSPIILLNYVVMPELENLKNFYSNVDAYAQDAAGIKTDLPERK